jgi:hypothetical protein
MKSATKIDFADMISEKEVIEKTGYTKSGLKYLRLNNKIKYAKLGEDGQKVVYFKSDIESRMNLKAIN